MTREVPMPGDVVQLIMDDHREVERLFERMKKEPDQRPMLVPVVATLLVAHSRAEESQVYPVAREEAGETEEVAHSQEEHAEAEAILERLRTADHNSSEFDSLLEELIGAVTHHVEEEEAKVLPGMTERLDKARLEELGEAFMTSRAQHMGEQAGDATKDELLRQARNAGIEGASSMSRDQLEEALKP
jgi:hemerythrin superfamily protein